MALEQHVRQLGGSAQAKALANAFGYGLDDPANLTTRREEFGRLNAKHSDTVELWENQMIDELTEVLLARYGVESRSRTVEQLTQQIDVMLRWAVNLIGVLDELGESENHAASIEDYRVKTEAYTALLREVGLSNPEWSDIGVKFMELMNTATELEASRSKAAGRIGVTRMIAESLVKLEEQLRRLDSEQA